MRHRIRYATDNPPPNFSFTGVRIRDRVLYSIEVQQWNIKFAKWRASFDQQPRFRTQKFIASMSAAQPQAAPAATPDATGPRT